MGLGCAGLAAASEAITYMFPVSAWAPASAASLTPRLSGDKDKEKERGRDQADLTSLDTTLTLPPLRLHDSYQVSMIRTRIIYLTSTHFILSHVRSQTRFSFFLPSSSRLY